MKIVRVYHTKIIDQYTYSRAILNVNLKWLDPDNFHIISVSRSEINSIYVSRSCLDPDNFHIFSVSRSEINSI